MAEKVLVNYKKRVQIPKGTVLSDSKEQQWMVGATLKFRGSRNIYAVAPCDGKSSEDYTSVVIFKSSSDDPQSFEMQSRICNPDAIDEWKDKKQLRHLGVTPILGTGNYNCDGQVYSFIITQRYKDNLQQLLARNKTGFIPSTVYKVIGEMIQAFEYIHSHGYYGFNINGTKLLQGFTNPSHIYLDVIGHGETPECLAFKSRDAQAGTAIGDLESILYIALHFMKLQLPWKKNSMDESAINKQKAEAFNDIENFLQEVFGKYKILAPLRHMMNEIGSTRDDNNPDYKKIQSIIAEGIRNINNVNDRIDSSLNFTKELKLRKCSSRKAVNENLQKRLKTNTASKKQTLSERNQVKEPTHDPVLTLNRDELTTDWHQIQSEITQQSTAASAAEVNVETKTVNEMPHSKENLLKEAAVFVAQDNVINVAVDTIAAQDSYEASQNDTPETMMTSPILSLKKENSMTPVATMPTETNTHSKITVPKLSVIDSEHLQQHEGGDKLTESEGNHREDTMAKVMLKEEAKEIGLKKQQLTILDVPSEARADTNDNESEEDLLMTDSPENNGAGDETDQVNEDSVQRSDATSTTQPPDRSELPMMNDEVQLLKRELEQCEDGLALGDDSEGVEDPKLVDRVERVAGCITDMKADFFNSCYEIQQELGCLKGLQEAKPVIEIEREQREKSKRSQSKIDRSAAPIIILGSSDESEAEAAHAAATQQDAEPLLLQNNELKQRARTRDNQLKEASSEQNSKDKFQQKSKGKLLRSKKDASSDSDRSDVDKYNKRKMRRRTPPSHSDDLDSDYDRKKMEEKNFKKKTLDVNSNSRHLRGSYRKKFRTMTCSKNRQSDSESDSSLSRCNKKNNESRSRSTSHNQDSELSPIRPSGSIDNSKSRKDSKSYESRSKSDFNPSYRQKNFNYRKHSNDYQSGSSFKNSRRNTNFSYRKANDHSNIGSLRSSEKKYYTPNKYLNQRPWSRYGNYHSRPWQYPSQNKSQHSFGRRNYRDTSRSPSRNRRSNSFLRRDSRSTSPISSVASSKGDKRKNCHERFQYSPKKDKEMKRPEQKQLCGEISGSGQATVQRGFERHDLDLNSIEKKVRQEKHFDIDERGVNHDQFGNDGQKKEPLKVNKPLVDYTDDEDS